MQIVGLILLAFVVSFGFEERTDTTISALDLHAAVMVLGGSFAAVLISSSAATALRTFLCLREILPGLGTLQRATDALEAERVQLTALWLEGRRAQAVELAARSDFPAVDRMLKLALSRAPEEATQAAFTKAGKKNQECVLD